MGECFETCDEEIYFLIAAQKFNLSVIASIFSGMDPSIHVRWVWLERSSCGVKVWLASKPCVP